MALPQAHGVSAESARPLPPLSRRRDKPQLSCTLCRRGKLKCDRDLPCESCTRRGLSLSCTYPASVPLQSGKRVIHPSTAMHDRVAQLEKLVLSLKYQADIKGHTHSVGPIRQDIVSPDVSELPKSFGRIGLENTETTYVEGSHWTAILDGIAELKDYFDDRNAPETFNSNEKDIEIDSSLQKRGPALVLGDFQRLNRQEILASVPPRSVVDGLVAKYFNSKNINSLLIHGPTFLEEYDQFWEYPQKASMMWVGLLFGIICLGALYQQLETSCSDSLALPRANLELSHSIQVYRDRVTQCLALADYTKCVPYTVETLLHYLAIEYLNVTDSHTGVWVLMGIIVQIAVRMGYHRDGSHSSRLSPFQTEMRRRVWAVIFQIDSTAASQFGLPRMINDSQVDTREPQDLSDDALSPDMKELPHSRTVHEPSSIQFLVMKNRFVSIYNMIIDLINSPKKAVSYEEVMKLDKILEEQFQTMPLSLCMRPMSRSLTDTADVIVNRIFLALSYYKSRCLLHREHMLAARSNQRYLYSRTSCLKAALEILHIQISLYEETQLGRRLYHEKWKFSAMVKHVFLLATTILCVDLDHCVRELRNEKNFEDPILSEVIQALKTSYSIWLQSSDMSREALKATKMLRVVLNKAPNSASLLTDLPPLTYDRRDSTTLSTNFPDLGNDISFFNQLSENMDEIGNLEKAMWNVDDWTGSTSMDDIIRQSDAWPGFDIS